MATLAILLVVVLLISLMPAFAPPTWMAMATFARSLVRGRLMRESDRQNIDVVRAWLEKHKTMTVSAFFLYALSPFPSNFLFIAYGLSGVPLKVIGAALFVGRTVSHAVWAHLGRFVSAHIDPEVQFEGGYLSGYFVVTQLVLLGLVYILMKLDWKMLLEQRKLAWRRRSLKAAQPGRSRRHHRALNETTRYA
ncbi:TVP38/TMEM64 family membrane protein [Paraburkholderia sacchari]|uniref:hypothetical protein n=1 Tax=Paraburkholderia sacchari TaxID=159450 RepID=UPI0039A5E9F0